MASTKVDFRDPTAASPACFLLLHPRDNILVCTSPVPAGTSIKVDGADCVLAAAIQLGHKIARMALAAGDKVYRYGMPIGTMTAPALRGEHVHRHNLASDYMPAHGRGPDGIKDIRP